VNIHLKPKADKRYVNESELLWAVIDGANGSLDRRNGVTFTNKSDTGEYQVRFDRNVRNCVYVASVGLPASLGVELPGQIGVVGENASVRGVWIDTYDSLGNQADRSSTARRLRDDVGSVVRTAERKRRQRRDCRRRQRLEKQARHQSARRGLRAPAVTRSRLDPSH
jgi:hypothetical protein